mgnify:CR=1 FL=1
MLLEIPLAYYSDRLPRVQIAVWGAAVWAIGSGLGGTTGFAINPARDFGPRLFTAFAGWGSGVFTAANNWWWVPIVGPLVGGVLGSPVARLGFVEETAALVAGVRLKAVSETG